MIGAAAAAAAVVIVVAAVAELLLPLSLPQLTAAAAARRCTRIANALANAVNADG